MSSEHRAPPPARVPRRAGARRADPSAVNRSAARLDAVREVEREIETWRAVAVPDPSIPLDAEDVARLVGECLTVLGLGEAIASSFTINTVHFYRRKEILDAPEGRTSAARYTIRHLWQAVGARLAGQLGLLTLAEAREAMSGRTERVLLGFVAERVLDARARQAVRRAAAPLVAARPLASSLEGPGLTTHRPVRVGNAPPRAVGTHAIVVNLPGDAWCVIPSSHPAHRSAAAARALGRALTEALRAGSDVTLDS